jgi:hypothetical protein
MDEGTILVYCTVAPLLHLLSELPPPPSQTKMYSITINVPVVYMVRYKVVLRGDYP